MRQLWDDHVFWTRLYIVSALGDLPDKAATTERLLRNQTDIGNAIQPFYGEAAGTKLTALLRDHILIAADIVGAAKAGNTSVLESSKTRW
ncbi:MAG TPA: acetylglutamate kinase, partial [Thermoanaerobaculia bacterium]